MEKKELPNYIKILSIIGPAAIITSGISGYVQLTAMAQESVKRIDKIEQAIINIKDEFYQAKQEIIKTQSKVSNINEKVENLKPQISREIDQVQKKIDVVSTDMKTQQNQMMEILIDIRSNQKSKEISPHR